MLDINKIKELLEKEKIDELTVYLNEHREQSMDLMYAFGVNFYDKENYVKAISCFETAAKNKHPSSIGYLAFIYFHGEGTSKDYKKAFEYAKMGADLNDENSIYILGLLYQLGFVEDYLFLVAKSERLEPAYDKAFEMFKKGEELGDYNCKFEVAKAYYYGRGVDCNETIAKAYFEEFAKEKDSEAMWYLSDLYYNSKNLRDINKSYEWSTEGALLGNVKCAYMLGIIYKDKKEYDLAFKWFKASETYDYSLFEIGWFYYFGKGVPKDFTMALQYFKKVEHLPAAQLMLGQCYYFGEGCVKDSSVAFHYYEQAAMNGQSVAMGNLASMYYDGDGVEQNKERVLYWATQAANKTHEKGYFYLGALYAEGECLLKDDKQAFNYLHKSATLGDAVGQYWTAMFYKEGRGTEKNNSLYLEWLKKAADQGHEKAKKELRNYYYTH